MAVCATSNRTITGSTGTITFNVPVMYVEPGLSVDTCPYLLMSQAEYKSVAAASAAASVQTPSYPAWNELGSLSIADAQVITGYVGLLWAGVWGIKQIVKSVSIFERNQDE